MSTLSQTPSIGLQTRIIRISKLMQELQVTPEQLYAFGIADGTIECTRGMQEEDPEIDMPGTTEAYIEAGEAALVDAADAWLTFLLNK